MTTRENGELPEGEAEHDEDEELRRLSRRRRRRRQEQARGARQPTAPVDPTVGGPDRGDA
jgi:hypothetical protein